MTPEILYPIKVNFEHTNNVYQANQMLNRLPPVISADFEIASMYSVGNKAILMESKEEDYRMDRERIQKIKSNGLSHPSMTLITHLSIAWSPKDAFVFVCDNHNMRKFVLKFLIETDRVQLWHNAVFDFKHIYYYTHRLPKHYIDTRLLTKCLLNNADGQKNKVGLKELMGYAYGAWAISPDEFTLEEIHNPNMLLYSATDACATFKLFNDICEDLDYEPINQKLSSNSRTE